MINDSSYAKNTSKKPNLKINRLRLKKPPLEFANLSRFVGKNLKLIIEFAVVVVFVGLAYLSLLRIDVEQANYAIQENMVGYFNALNKQEYGKMRQYLYPTDNSEYLLDIMVKAKAVGITSVRLQTIYPALVDGDIAITGFETSTNAIYQGKDLTARQTNTFFFRKKDGRWYIAKPEDLTDISAQKISDMIDAYNPIIKENMNESIVEQQKYNESSAKKMKETSN